MIPRYFTWSNKDLEQSREMPSEKDSPFNIFLDMVDGNLSAGCDVTKAMVLANNQLVAAQKERRPFQPSEFDRAMVDIVHMIRRRPDSEQYEQVFKGVL